MDSRKNESDPPPSYYTAISTINTNAASTVTGGAGGQDDVIPSASTPTTHSQMFGWGGVVRGHLQGNQKQKQKQNTVVVYITVPQ